MTGEKEGVLLSSLKLMKGKAHEPRTNKQTTQETKQQTALNSSTNNTQKQKNKTKQNKSKATPPCYNRLFM
jgi:hypothetical protein